MKIIIPDNIKTFESAWGKANNGDIIYIKEGEYK